MRRLLPIIFLLLSYSGFAQEYEWVNFYGGNNEQRPISMSVDEEGNQYATFNFRDEFKFDTFSLSKSGNNYYGVVLKQKNDGSLIWYKEILPVIPHGFIFNINSRFKSNGNLIVLTASNSPLLIENDTINRYGNNSQFALYILEFDTTGKLIHSAHLIEGPLSSFNFTQNRVTTDSDENLYLGLSYTSGKVKIYDTNGVDSIDLSINSIVIFKFSNSGKNYEWSKQYSTNHHTLNSLKVDKTGNIYMAFLRVGLNFIFNGQTVTLPQIYSGLVLILDANGNDKNYFYLETSGSTSSLRTTFLDLAVHDSNSIFVTGSYLGDSAKFGSKWLSNKKGGVYYFYAKYDNNGNNIWVKQEDTSRSNHFIGWNSNGSMTNFEDKYFYSSIHMPRDNYPVRIDGQDYGTNIYGNGFNAKVDERGNILWGFITPIAFIAQGTDKYENYYFQGSWYMDTIRFGKFWSVGNTGDAFIGKTYDYSITRGEVKSGPYCAGDTLLIPYTKFGNYNDSNYFIAELSDEYGNFTGNERELGRIQSTDSGIIIGILPLFEVASSDLYRIRIRSTNPQVQSFYRLDTLRLLIYSRDKADPGPPELVCFGDSFKLRTYGGTAWKWSPAYNMDDSSSRTPYIIPDKDTIYRIVISDSSGCGEADTAFKQIYVRELPKISIEDSLAICHNMDAELIAHFESGDTAGYHWNWYAIDSLNQWQLLKSDSFKLSDTLYYRLSEDIITYQKLVIVLDDECSVIKDTVFIRLYLTSGNMSSEISNSDSIACYNSIQTLTAQFMGGDPETFSWQWFEVVSDSQFILLKTDSLALNDTLIVQPGVDIFEFQRYALISKDECTPFFDTSYYTVYIDQSRPVAQVFPQDSAICPGTGIEITSEFNSGSILGYNWQWIDQNGQILEHDSGFYLTNFETIPQFSNQEKQTYFLILSDNCSPYKDTAHIDIYPREPITVFATPQDTLLCVGQEITFSATGTGGIPENYHFRWEDAETGELLGEEETLNITASVTIPNAFRIRIILTDGCMPKGDSTIVSLRVNPQLEAMILKVPQKLELANDTTVCNGTELQYFAQGFGGDSDNYSYAWYLNDSLISTEEDVKIRFLKRGNYSTFPYSPSTLSLILKDDCSINTDTQSLTITILPPLSVSSEIPDTICQGSEKEYTFTALANGGLTNNYSYQWLFNNSVVSTQPTVTLKLQQGEIQLILSDGCSVNDTFLHIIDFHPQPEGSLDPVLVCENMPVTLRSTNQSSFATHHRLLPNGTSYNLNAGTSVLHEGETAMLPSYTATLHMESTEGCISLLTKTFPVSKAPEPTFTWVADRHAGDLHFRFTGSQEGDWEAESGESGSGIVWEVGFNDTGMILVTFRVVSGSGCEGEVSELIPVYEDIELYVPNAFSPNADGHNETWKPGNSQFIKEYHVRIWNHWGQMVHESTNPHQGWNGAQAQQGVYLFIINATDIYGKKHNVKGTVHLIR